MLKTIVHPCWKVLYILTTKSVCEKSASNTDKLTWVAKCTMYSYTRYGRSREGECKSELQASSTNYILAWNTCLIMQELHANMMGVICLRLNCSAPKLTVSSQSDGVNMCKPNIQLECLVHSCLVTFLRLWHIKIGSKNPKCTQNGATFFAMLTVTVGAWYGQKPLKAYVEGCTHFQSRHLSKHLLLCAWEPLWSRQLQACTSHI